jgi:hypothetical protein
MMSELNAADLTELDVGDEITVEYVSKNSDSRDVQTVTAEILRMDTDTSEGYVFGDVYLAVHRDEDDHLPRRRIHITADSFTVEYRRTTRNGPEWNRLSTATSVTVTAADGGEDEDGEDADEDADSEGGEDTTVECSRCNGSGERGPDIMDPDECDTCGGTGEVQPREALDADGEPVREGDTVTVQNGSMTERVETVHPDGRVTLADGWTHPSDHLHVEGEGGEDGPEPRSDGGDEYEPDHPEQRPSDGSHRCPDCGARVAAYAPTDHREDCPRAPGGEVCQREFGDSEGPEVMTDGGVDTERGSRHRRGVRHPVVAESTTHTALTYHLRAICEGSRAHRNPEGLDEQVAADALRSEDSVAFLAAVARDPYRSLDARNTAHELLSRHVTLGSGNYWWAYRCPDCLEGEVLLTWADGERGYQRGDEPEPRCPCGRPVPVPTYPGEDHSGDVERSDRGARDAGPSTRMERRR